MPIDPNAPELAPIEGISLEQYADLAVGMQGLDENGMREHAESHGVAAGKWDAVKDGWNARFEQSHGPRPPLGRRVSPGTRPNA